MADAKDKIITLENLDYYDKNSIKPMQNSLLTLAQTVLNHEGGTDNMDPFYNKHMRRKGGLYLYDEDINKDALIMDIPALIANGWLYLIKKKSPSDGIYRLDLMMGYNYENYTKKSSNSSVYIINTIEHCTFVYPDFVKMDFSKESSTAYTDYLSGSTSPVRVIWPSQLIDNCIITTSGKELKPTGIRELVIPDTVTDISPDALSNFNYSQYKIYYKGPATGAPWGAPNATIITDF